MTTETHVPQQEVNVEFKDSSLEVDLKCQNPDGGCPHWVYCLGENACQKAGEQPPDPYGPIKSSP